MCLGLTRVQGSFLESLITDRLSSYRLRHRGIETLLFSLLPVE
ncbi:MAG: hypothetical protein PWQ39_411 [Thermacetogenium sp.]|nr:hypothetical protein [Thermacetogenium sp.]